MTDVKLPCQQCEAWRKSLFQAIGQEQLDRLATVKAYRKLNRGDVLFHQGDPVDGIFCHKRGLVKVVQRDDADKVRFARLVLPGDSSGHRSVFIENTYKGTADVLSDEAELCFIPRQTIIELLTSNGNFAKNLVVKIAMEVQRTEEDSIDVREQNVAIRLARLLFRLCEEFSEQLEGERRLIPCIITKADIAKLLLVANETVIRLMSDLKKDSIISYRDKRIVIEDIHALKQLCRM